MVADNTAQKGALKNENLSNSESDQKALEDNNEAHALRDDVFEISHHPEYSIPELMARIRQRVEKDVVGTADSRPQFQPSAPTDAAPRRAGELLYSEELRYLNSNYMFGPGLNLDAITSHRPGLLGKLIVKVKRKLMSMVWNLLKDYFTAEREYQASLVRYLNDVAKYVDARDASNFWDLIKKVDVDVTRALERIERINDEQMASLRTAERKLYDVLNKTAAELLQEITDLQGKSRAQEATIETLQTVVGGLESILARYSNGKSAMSVTHSSQCQSDENRHPSASTIPDCSYLLLENRYRGSEVGIKARQRFYPSLFSSVPTGKRILEIGPGRGELLE